MNRQINPPVRTAIWLFAVAAFLFSTCAFAVDAIDHLNVQEPELPSYLPKDPGNNFRLPTVPPASAEVGPEVGGGKIFYVKHILFRGNTVISSAELDKVSASYVGRPVDESEIEALRQKLSRYYVDRGFTNSGALLPENAFDGETLTFQIIEGRLGTLRLQGLNGLNKAYLAGRLLKDKDEVLNVDILRERFQLLLDDPLFERMNARLMPGVRLGEAILDIDVERALPYQFSVFANNYRPPSIGENAFGMSGWIRNLSGYGDVLDASLQNSIPERESPRYSVGWGIPLNARGTQLALRVDRGRSSVIEGQVASLDITSRLDTTDLVLKQTVIESLQHKLTLGIDRVWRTNRTTLLGEPFSFTPGEPDGTTKVNAWRLWQEYSYRTEKQVIALRSIFTVAQNNLQTIPGLPSGEIPQPDSAYNLWLGQVHYARQVLGKGTQFILRGNIQHTSDNLLPLDRMSIGGNLTVRGYRENQILADNGSVFNLEFNFPIPLDHDKNLHLTVIPFYDWGHGRNVGMGPVTLSSMGLTTRARWRKLNIDLTLAKRIAYPTATDLPRGSLQDQGIHWQVSYAFF